jgi:hypothetical protein
VSVCGWFAEVCVGGPFPVWADPGHRGTKDPFSWNLLWQAVHWLHHRLSVSLGVYPINPICCRSFLRISLPIGNRSQSKLGGHLEDTWRTPGGHLEDTCGDNQKIRSPHTYVIYVSLYGYVPAVCSPRRVIEGETRSLHVACKTL